MKKKQSTLPKQQEAIPATDLSAFGQLFLIKDDVLYPEPEFHTTAEFLPRPPLTPADASSLIFANRAVIFGDLTAGVLEKGNVYPFAAYLFDMTNPTRPCLLLLSITTGITETMISMITLNAFMGKKEHRATLVEELGERLKKDKRFAKTMRELAPASQDALPVIEQAVQKSMYGMCIANVDDQEGIKLINSYRAVHSDLIHVMFLSSYRVGKSVLLSVVPPYTGIVPKVPTKRVAQESLTEEEHLKKLTAEPLRAAYLKLKAAIQKTDASVVFNPKRYYISLRKDRNMAFFHFKKSVISVVIMGSEQEIVKAMKHYKVTLLGDSVKRFWNGECATVTIGHASNIQEVIQFLQKKIKEKKKG